MQAKEWGNPKLKFIVTHNLGNGVRTISEWFEFTVGSDKTFLLQMLLDFAAHLKLVWHPMLIISLLVLGILFLYKVMELLVDMLDVPNEVICLIDF